MEQVGTIIKILPPVSGTSQRTGNPWTAQSFVIDVSTGEHGQYKRKQVYELFGEEKIKEAQLFEGKQVKVSFDIEAREHEGKWYNSVRVWKVEQIGGQMPPQQNVPQYQQQGGYGQQYRPQQPPQGGYYPSQGGYAPQQGGYYPQQPQQQYQPQPQFPQPEPGRDPNLPF